MSSRPWKFYPRRGIAWWRVLWHWMSWPKQPMIANINWMVLGRCVTKPVDLWAVTQQQEKNIHQGWTNGIVPPVREQITSAPSAQNGRHPSISPSASFISEHTARILMKLGIESHTEVRENFIFDRMCLICPLFYTVLKSRSIDLWKIAFRYEQPW
jgi:hypothetical protein